MKPLVWFIIILYLVLNFALNYGNKYILGLFHYPVFIIFVGTVMYAPFTAVLISCGRVSSFPTKKQARAALPMLLFIGIVHALGTAANNVSVSKTSVGINQIIKSCSPIVTISCSALLEHKRYHWSVVCSTVMIVIGSIMATFTTANAFIHPGVVFAAISTVLGGLECVLIGMVMRKHQLHAAQVTLLISLPAALSLLPLVFYFEVSEQFFASLFNDGFFVSLLVGLLSGKLFCFVLVLLFYQVTASFYSYLHYLLIAKTSAHYTNLIGSVKVALIVGASFFVIERHSTSHLNAVGIGLTISSFFAYSILKSYNPEVENVPAPPKEKTEDEMRAKKIQFRRKKDATTEEDDLPV